MALFTSARMEHHQPAVTISESPQSPRNPRQSVDSNSSLRSRTTKSGSITITCSKNASTSGRSCRNGRESGAIVPLLAQICSTVRPRYRTLHQLRIPDLPLSKQETAGDASLVLRLRKNVLDALERRAHSRKVFAAPRRSYSFRASYSIAHIIYPPCASRVPQPQRRMPALALPQIEPYALTKERSTSCAAWPRP